MQKIFLENQIRFSQVKTNSFFRFCVLVWKIFNEKKVYPENKYRILGKKITRNIERDKEVDTLLKEEGWTVLHFWEPDNKKSTENYTDVHREYIKKIIKY